MSVDPPYKVLLVGHSYVYWLRSFVETTLLGPGFADFVVDGDQCDVGYNGVRGATVNTFLDPDMFARIIVCLCLGGNDLSTATPVMIALDIIRLARRLLSSGVQCVCVGQVCRRLRWRNVSHSVGDSLAQELNGYLESCSNDTEGVIVWRHKRLWTSIRPVFRQDGVHFSDEGNYRLFRSIRGAIMTAVRRILPLGRLTAWLGIVLGIPVSESSIYR